MYSHNFWNQTKLQELYQIWFFYESIMSSKKNPKCSLCNETFLDLRGLTQHLKKCPHVQHLQQQNNQFYDQDKILNLTTRDHILQQDFVTNNDNQYLVDENITKKTSINQQKNESSYTLELSSDKFNNNYDQKYTKNSKEYSETQLQLIAQETSFDNKMKNAHKMWSNTDLGKLELLKILQKHKCPNSAYEEIFGWAVHYNNLPRTTIFQKGSKIQKRDTFLKELQLRRNMESMKPIVKKIDVVQSKSTHDKVSIDVTTFDFKQQLLLLLRDKELMQETNLMIEDNDTIQSPNRNKKHSDDTISEIQDSDWYKGAKEYYDEKFGEDKARIICGVILTVDKTHTDWKGKLCLEPVQFTLSIFNTETRRKKASAWKCLGFINDLDAFQSSQFYTGNVYENLSADAKTNDTIVDEKDNHGEDNTPKKNNRHKNTELKSIIYHRILSCILESLRECQNTGLAWDLKFPTGTTQRVNFVFPLCFCVVDMKGARQLCGMYDTASNVQRPCVSCYCEQKDLHVTSKICKPVIATEMEAIIMGCTNSNKDSLRKMSQHSNPKNAFFNIDMAGWKYGIWGMCPSEVLHQFYEGVILYALEEFIDRVLTNKYRSNLELAMSTLMSHMTNQSARDTYPTGVFTMGITRLKAMKGIEKFASVFYIALFLNTELAKTLYFEGKKQLPADIKSIFLQWRKLFERCCYYHDWLMKKSFVRSSLKVKHARIIELYKQFQTLIKRKEKGFEKGINNIPKFHEFFHITRNIKNHGPPIGYATLCTESNHQPVKAASKNTQQQVHTFTSQTGNRIFEKNIVDSTYDFIQSFSKETFLGKKNKRKTRSFEHYDTSTMFPTNNSSKCKKRATSKKNDSSLLPPQSRYGLFYARFDLETKEVDFVKFPTKLSKPVANDQFIENDLTIYFQTKLFSLMENMKAVTYLPCYTTLIRNGISFRGLSRDTRNNPGWAMFQWQTNTGSNITCPGKILTFVDFSNMSFKKSAASLYPIQEFHVVLHSLCKTPQEKYGHRHSSICSQALLEKKEYMYHCVSINTIYDGSFIIPNLGHKDPMNVLYVFPRLYDTTGTKDTVISENDNRNTNINDIGISTDDTELGWSNKF